MLPCSVRLPLEQIKLMESLGIDFSKFVRELLDFFLNDEEYLSVYLKEKETEVNNIKKKIKAIKKYKVEKEAFFKKERERIIKSTINFLKERGNNKEFYNNSLNAYVNYAKGNAKDFEKKVKKELKNGKI